MIGTSGHTLRATTSGDREIVTALLEASYQRLLAADYDPRLLARALPLMTKANPRLLESGTYYVVETRDGSAVGCGGWTLEVPGGGASSRGVGHIRHFAIHPEWTRQGIGKALLRHCIEEARALGIGQLECLSTLTAIAFYESAGFIPVAKTEVQMSPTVTFPSLLMRFEFL